MFSSSCAVKLFLIPTPGGRQTGDPKRPDLWTARSQFHRLFRSVQTSGGSEAEKPSVSLIGWLQPRLCQPVTDPVRCCSASLLPWPAATHTFLSLSLPPRRGHRIEFQTVSREDDQVFFPEMIPDSHALSKTTFQISVVVSPGWLDHYRSDLLGHSKSLPLHGGFPFPPCF